jgi:phosphoribosylglycinamide formyltransferase 1
MAHKFSNPVRLAVLVSGSGRSLHNLIHLTASGSLPANIGLVVASRPCLGAQIAEQHAIPAVIIPAEMNEHTLLELVQHHNIDLVVLAGYLRRLPIPAALEGRVLNIHPALLPRFGGPGMYGHHVHEAVLAAARSEGLTQSGCTVHLCNNEYDKGQILLQRTCPILQGDTPDSLAARVFEQELVAYPQAIRDLIASQSLDAVHP